MSVLSFALVMIYWRVGQRIRQEILKEKGAGYGEQIGTGILIKLFRNYYSNSLRGNLDWRMMDPERTRSLPKSHLDLGYENLTVKALLNLFG